MPDRSAVRSPLAQGSSLSVLVTDASYKHAVGIIRALGRAGHRVCAVSSVRLAPGFRSRFTSQWAVVPEPAKDARGFIDAIQHNAAEWQIDLLVPVGFASCSAVVHHPDAFAAGGPFVVVPEAALFDAVADKASLLEKAAGFGINVPESVTLEEVTKAHKLLARHRRVVLKRRSEAFGGRTQYIESPARLDRAIQEFQSQLSSDHLRQMIIQEYVPGFGCGYMALAWHGRIVREFAHRRRREWPPRGGASTAAESVADTELIRQGRLLLESLGWHGPAMVEFRRNRDGDHLMELNPKFWGSLELALAAGADYPGDLCRLACGEDLTSRPLPPYRAGLRFWWPWRGDLRRLCLRPGDVWSVLSDLVSPRAQSNWDWRDPLPNFMEIGGEILYPVRRHH
ncbi:MAG: ATP-grasp domain-containing protein [Candidatus Zixiibacteriota bacterium]